MLFLNPQWQGSGLKDELKYGAETLKAYFKNHEMVEIPLSNKGLAIHNNIKCYHPILEQTQSFKAFIDATQPCTISTIGGDCAVDLMPISYLNKKYNSDFCIIWIDAHGDLNTPESSPSKNFHGMCLRTLLGEGDQLFVEMLYSTLQHHQVYLVGMRDLDPPEIQYISRNHISLFTQCDWEDIHQKVRDFQQVYIHLDLDVLDKSEFSHTRISTTNGFLISDVTRLIQNLKRQHKVVGFCITESIATSLKQLQPIKSILDEIEIVI